MTTAEFNALPLEARRFIEKHANCLACGNKAAKIKRAYALYLYTIKMSAYILKGGVAYYQHKSGESGILRPLNSEDTDDQIREKLEIAKSIHAVKPHAFTAYNAEEIAKILEGLEPVPVIESEQAAIPRGNGGKFAKKTSPADEI